jgi:hypothetical protein
LRPNNKTSTKISNGNIENKTNSSTIGKIDDNNSDTKENFVSKYKYFIALGMIIITALLSYFWFKTSKPSAGGNDNINLNQDLNREDLNTRLNNLVNNNVISDSSSEGSDTTITQLSQYFNNDNTIENKVEEFVQGSSNSSNINSVSSIPTILFSSRFFDSFDENGKIKNDKDVKEDIKEEIIDEVKIQDDDSENIIDTWNKVEVKFLDNNNLNILFGRMAINSKSVLINTTDNQEIIYDLKFNIINNFTNDNFNWRSNLKFNDQTIKINKIFIKDEKGFFHLTYPNDDELIKFYNIFTPFLNRLKQNRTVIKITDIFTKTIHKPFFQGLKFFKEKNKKAFINIFV